MSDDAPAAELDLPFITYCELVAQFRQAMPAPADATPDGLLRRDRAAAVRIAELVPASTQEVALAVDYLAAEAWSMHCLHAASLLADKPDTQRQNLAMSRAMMRQSQGWLSMLLRVQAARRKREASKPERADWIQHCVLGTLRQAMGDPPEPSADPPLLPPPEEDAAADAPPAAAVEEPVRDLEAEAERYAVIYPARARAIRRYDGLPPNCDFGPPDDELMVAIVTGRTPALCALDQPPPGG